MKSVYRSLFLMLFVSTTFSACTIRLINVPGEQTGASNIVNLDVTVEASESIDQYQFRLVPEQSPDADCLVNLASYSPMQPRGTHLIQDFSNLPDGVLKLCVRATGTVTIQSEGSPPQESSFTKYVSASWTKDTVPPDPFAITGPTGVQVTNTPTITWEPAAGASSYKIDITSDAACENVYKTFPGISGTSFEIAGGIANGFWHVCVTATDLGSNNTPATNNGILMTVDAPFHYLFATSTTFTGAEIGSLALADDQCTLHAFIGNLIPDWNGVDVVYKAVLSDSTIHAKDRFVLDRSIFNRNNQLVTFGADLWSSTLGLAINYDENASLLGAAGVWTGTNPDGTYSGAACSDWSSNSGLGMSGVVDQTDTEWISSSDESCNVAKRIYCVGPF